MAFGSCVRWPALFSLQSAASQQHFGRKVNTTLIFARNGDVCDCEKGRRKKARLEDYFVAIAALHRAWVKKAATEARRKFDILAKCIVLYGYGFDAQLFCLIFQLAA